MKKNFVSEFFDFSFTCSSEKSWSQVSSVNFVSQLHKPTPSTGKQLFETIALHSDLISCLNMHAKFRY